MHPYAIMTFDKVVQHKRLSPECQLFHVFLIWNLAVFRELVEEMDFHHYSVSAVEELMQHDVSHALLHYPLDQYEIKALFRQEERVDGRYYITSRLAEEIKSQSKRWIANHPPQAVAFLNFINNSTKDFEITIFEDLKLVRKEAV